MRAILLICHMMIAGLGGLLSYLRQLSVNDAAPREVRDGGGSRSIERWRLLVIPALALLPMLLYITVGYGGHDFKYHATAWLELHDAWSAHEWRFGWSPWAHYGFGEPSFCFYPPLSLLIGAGLTFLAPFRFVPALVVWLVFTLSGLSMYKASRLFVAPENRLPVALLYMFNPYLLMTVVIRFAIAEAWCQALIPVVFLYFYVLVSEDRLRLTLVCACLLAATWLANISEAIGVFYALNLLALVLAVKKRSIRPLLAAALGQILGLVFAAFQLLPTLEEKPWISSQSLLIYDFRSFMQMRRVPPPHLMVYLSGIYIALSLLFLLPSLRGILRQDRRWGSAVLSLTVLAAFAVCFQLPVTTPLWEKLPQFKYILFPYRLLPLLSLASLLLLYSRGPSRRLQRVGAGSLALFALFPFLSFGRLLPSQRFPSIAAAIASWQTGYEGVREYLPVGVPARRAEPPTELILSKQGSFASAACVPGVLASHPNQKLISIGNPGACTLVLNTYYYPFWKASLGSGAPLPTDASGEGLLRVAVPAGTHQVVLNFLPETHTRRWAAWASLLTLCAALLVSGWRCRGGLPYLLFDTSIPYESAPVAKESIG